MQKSRKHTILRDFELFLRVAFYLGATHIKIANLKMVVDFQ